MITIKNAPLETQLKIIDSNSTAKVAKEASVDFVRNAKSLPAEQNYQQQLLTVLHHKSIFADSSGVLVTQKTDENGQIIATYPSPEVLRRYHAKLEE